jgi:hypothetical protein
MHPDDVRAMYMGANGLVAMGETEHGVEWAKKAVAMDPTEPMVLYNVACIQSMAGLPDDALDSLEAAFKHGLSQEGFMNWIEHDSNLDPIRSRPRFKRLTTQIRKIVRSRR